MKNVKFTNNSQRIKAQFDINSLNFLIEAKESLASQTARNTKRVTGQLADSFSSDSLVDESKGIAYIGSSVEYAPYYEMGTGEHALLGNGRKGGWVYRDIKTGKLIFTKGSQPKRPLYRAYIQKKEIIKKRARDVLGENLK